MHGQMGLKVVQKRLLLVLGLSGAVSIGFAVVRVIAAGNHAFTFLIWNLFLAWLPVLFAWWLVVNLHRQRWFSIENAALTALWLGFLPNSFYMVSDLIHIQSTGDISLLFDVVMLMSFAWNGLILGFVSLYIVHRELYRRFKPFKANAAIAGVLLLCSFAIYLGRYLRWNTWDVLINPAGLLFDVSDRFIKPVEHPQTFTTTLMFFVLLTSMYWTAWELVKVIRASAKD